MKTLVHMQFGSHVYGTNLPTSDTDFKAVHIPDPRQILLGTAKPAIHSSTNKAQGTKNSSEDVDFESYTLQKFMSMLLEGQTVALSMLYTPPQFISVTSSEWEFIRAYRKEWLHTKVSAFVGYCRTQANKYGIKGSRISTAKLATELFASLPPNDKLGEHAAKITTALKPVEHTSFEVDPHGTPMIEICGRKLQFTITGAQAHKIVSRIYAEYGERARQAETNNNIDWKAIMHAVRVLHEAEEILTSHTITYPRPEAELLLQIRKGELPYAVAATILEDGLERIETVAKNSTLPPQGNTNLAEAFVLTSYKNYIFARP